MMTNLTDAIQLIRQGRKEDGRRLLEAVLRLDPQDIQAWFWYVETLPGLENRIQALNACLKMNPGNPQVQQALQTLQRQVGQASPPPPASSKVDPFVSGWQPTPEPFSPKPAFDYGDGGSSSFGLDEEEQDYLASAPPESADEYGGSQPSKSSMDFYPPPSTSSKLAFDWDALEREENARRGKSLVEIPAPAIEPIDEDPEPPGRSYPFYLVWLTALFPIDMDMYSSVLNDPEAGIGRAIEWSAIVGVIGGVVTPILFFLSPAFNSIRSDPQFRSLINTDSFTTSMIIWLVMTVVVTPIMQVISLVIRAAILNFVALMFGGKGGFGRTAYAMSAYTAPLSLIGILFSSLVMLGLASLDTFMPFIWVSVILMGLYTSFLDVRGLMAVHEYSAWDAIKTLVAPGVIAGIFGCLINLVVGLTSLAF